MAVAGALLGFYSTAPAQATQENTGPNASIVRQAHGQYAYRTLSDGRDRGSEDFQLLVHPDGSRTMLIWHDLKARNAQFTVVLRVAKSFRPETAFVSYWVANGYKGSTTFQVQGDQVFAESVGPEGRISRSTEVPAQFSIGTHPVAADGWHLWYVDDQPEKAGVINLFSVEASPDLDKPILGQLVEMPYEVLGEEAVQTPAGTFQTTHYRLMGASDLWVTGEDRLLVRMIQPRFDREYLLLELEQSQSR
jgi:hypothetical protein